MPIFVNHSIRSEDCSCNLSQRPGQPLNQPRVKRATRGVTRITNRLFHAKYY